MLSVQKRAVRAVRTARTAKTARTVRTVRTVRTADWWIYVSGAGRRWFFIVPDVGYHSYENYTSCRDELLEPLLESAALRLCYDYCF